MQNVPSLADAGSEAESTPAPRPGIHWRAVTLELWEPIGAASIGGLCFGIADLWRVNAALGFDRLGWSTGAALLGLWLWFGQLIGLALGTARLLGTAIKCRLKSENAWCGLLAVVVTAISFLLARKVVEGGGIRRTQLAAFAPWVVPLCSAPSAWIAAKLLPRSKAHLPRWVLVVCGVSVAVAAVVLDAAAPGGYLSLHVLLLAIGLGVAALTFELIRVPTLAVNAVLVGSLLALPSLVAFPASRTARELLGTHHWAGAELIYYAQYHLDFDRDGHSPAFGGDDCNDKDATAFVGAVERAGDGRDSNCDGFDDPRPSSLVFEPFHAQANPRATWISERAQQFPTVVILIDALRFDRIGQPRFPNLLQLMQESMRFTRVFATSSSTLSSVPAMMSGRVGPNGSGRDNIARSLADAGQSSEFIAPDVLIAHFTKLGTADPLASFSARVSIPTDHARGWGAGDTISTGAQITAKAVARLDSAEPPNLLWLHYFDLHQWHALEEPWLQAHGDIARYDAVLERLDADLRPLLARRDRTNIVLVADHGEGLGSRGVTYHGNLVSQELTHIPFLVRVPGCEPATIDVPVTSTGVANLLRALRGLPADATADPSLLQLVFAKNVGQGPGFPSFERMQWSFLFGKHRLLYMPQQQLVELYDVDADPLEQKNLADEKPQLASDLLSRLFELRNEAQK